VGEREREREKEREIGLKPKEREESEKQFTMFPINLTSLFLYKFLLLKKNTSQRTGV
jgi:hypothetical protein